MVAWHRGLGLRAESSGSPIRETEKWDQSEAPTFLAPHRHENALVPSQPSTVSYIISQIMLLPIFPATLPSLGILLRYLSTGPFGHHITVK